MTVVQALPKYNNTMLLTGFHSRMRMRGLLTLTKKGLEVVSFRGRAQECFHKLNKAVARVS